jgi:hypothetical protein
MRSTFARRRFLVDPSFQLRLVFLMGGYLLLWTIAVFHVYFLYFAMWNLLDSTVHKGLVALYIEFWSREQLILITLFLIAPVVAYKMFKFSHRIAGPLFRCRQLMREMAEGKTVAEFKPREHDLLDDFVRDFNLLVREWNTRFETGRVGGTGDRNEIALSDDGISSGANDTLAAPAGHAAN